MTKWSIYISNISINRVQNSSWKTSMHSFITFTLFYSNPQVLRNSFLWLWPWPLKMFNNSPRRTSMHIWSPLPVQVWSPPPPLPTPTPQVQVLSESFQKGFLKIPSVVLIFDPRQTDQHRWYHDKLINTVDVVTNWQTHTWVGDKLTNTDDILTNWVTQMTLPWCDRFCRCLEVFGVFQLFLFFLWELPGLVLGTGITGVFPVSLGPHVRKVGDRLQERDRVYTGGLNLLMTQMSLFLKLQSTYLFFFTIMSIK